MDTMKLINLQLFNDPLNNSLEESKRSPPSSESAPGTTDMKEQKSLLKVPSSKTGTDGLLSLSDINKYQI